jgi:hypothetical protein
MVPMGKNLDWLEFLFLFFMPRTYIETTVLIPATNLQLPGAPLTLGQEFLVFLGLWFVMATTIGASSRKDFRDSSCLPSQCVDQSSIPSELLHEPAQV